MARLIRAGRSDVGVQAAGSERLTDMYFPRGLTAFLKTSNTFLERAFFFPSLLCPSLPLSLSHSLPAFLGSSAFPFAAACHLTIDMTIYGRGKAGEVICSHFQIGRTGHFAATLGRRGAKGFKKGSKAQSQGGGCATQAPCWSSPHPWKSISESGRLEPPAEAAV